MGTEGGTSADDDGTRGAVGGRCFKEATARSCALDHHKQQHEQVVANSSILGNMARKALPQV